MAKHSVTNVSAGPRILNSTPPVLLQPGQATDGEVEISDAEMASMEATGYFEFKGGDAPEPGPLDQSIPDLEKHLENVTDADEVQKLLDAETAGKSRSGAIAVLEARRDALLV